MVGWILTPEYYRSENVSSRSSRFLSLAPFCSRAGYWLSLLHDSFSKFTSTRTCKHHQWLLSTPIHVAGGALGGGGRREGRGEARRPLTKAWWQSLLSKQTASRRHGSSYSPLLPVRFLPRRLTSPTPRGRAAAPPWMLAWGWQCVEGRYRQC